MSVCKNTQEAPFSEHNVSSYLRSIAFFYVTLNGDWWEGREKNFLHETPSDKNVKPNSKIRCAIKD